MQSVGENTLRSITVQGLCFFGFSKSWSTQWSSCLWECHQGGSQKGPENFQPLDFRGRLFKPWSGKPKRCHGIHALQKCFRQRSGQGWVDLIQKLNIEIFSERPAGRSNMIQHDPRHLLTCPESANIPARLADGKSQLRQSLRRSTQPTTSQAPVPHLGRVVLQVGQDMTRGGLAAYTTLTFGRHFMLKFLPLQLCMMIIYPTPLISRWYLHTPLANFLHRSRATPF